MNPRCTSRGSSSEQPLLGNTCVRSLFLLLFFGGGPSKYHLNLHGKSPKSGHETSNMRSSGTKSHTQLLCSIRQVKLLVTQAQPPGVEQTTHSGVAVSAFPPSRTPVPRWWDPSGTARRTSAEPGAGAKNCRCSLPKMDTEPKKQRQN